MAHDEKLKVKLELGKPALGVVETGNEEVTPEVEEHYEDEDPKLERMADEVHQVWCKMMMNLFQSGDQFDSGHFLIHPMNVRRWQRLMMIPYSELHEMEKKSVREIARRYLDVADTE